MYAVSYGLLSNEQILDKLCSTIKQFKLCQLYLKDVSDDYGKVKIAKLRYEFIKHECFNLLNEAKARGLKLGEEEKGIANLIFN